MSVTALPIPQPGAEVFASFTGDVSPASAQNIIATLSQIANQGVSKVTLMLSTLGGSVMHGQAIYNTLRALPVQLVTHNVGCVNSIGTVVFLAGDERYACQHSSFMFHGVSLGVEGATLDTGALKEMLSGLDQDGKAIASVIAERTGLTTRDVAKLFRERRTRDAAWAAGAGMIHGVRDANVPSGTQVVTIPA
ncbi:MAG: ATP-dependent Clp protease proteolytic subunit [Actinomycetota bacterium]